LWVREILSDLVAEQQYQDQFLQRTNIRDWKKRTPAGKWSIQDTVSHLASFEEYAYNALEEDGSRLEEASQYETYDEFTLAGVMPGRKMRPQDVIEWWREARAKVVDSLSRRTPSDRVSWFAGDMSAKTFATARLMETWAHGLDIHTTLDAEPEDTPRLRHIAWLAWKTLPNAFEEAGQPYEKPVRVEVIGPAYAKYVFGEEDTDQVIKGTAGDWCRVAVRRLSADDTSLKAQGQVAEMALKVARAYL
jgi:uncharacterized protein (TIGR03084 family)